MEKRVELDWLADFYGPLLTERQRAVLSMYCGDDMSLQEIADTLGVSRQAAHETVRAAQTQLEGYEKALGLMRRYRAISGRVAECRRALSAVRGADEGDKRALDAAIRALDDIISIER